MRFLYQMVPRQMPTNRLKRKRKNIFVLHESVTAYKHLGTKINAVCFAENIEILG